MLDHRPIRWAVAGIVAVLGVFAFSATTVFGQSRPKAKAKLSVDAQLAHYAGTNWPENGGDIENDRYSTLTQINKSNVGTLTQAWADNLNLCPSGQASCGSEEATPVEQDGVLYIQTPINGVYAINATNGAILWNWVPPYSTWDPGFQVGSGGRQPGVSLGQGKVYVGLADGSLVALNQSNGQLVWRTIAGPWQEGIRLSAAPLYYDGTVYEPTSGGDSGSISTSIEAFSAIDGALLWSWGVVPQAGQKGANTWSTANGGAYTSNTYGGGSTWQTPAIDTKDHLLIVGTGNPVPWNTRGPGSNLYTDSIVGLNLETGQLKWYYQTVHHDLWDSDLPNNPIVYTAKMDVPIHGANGGKKVPETVTAVADVAKYGWTWLLNAKTGKPLEKVDQVKVPQDKAPGVNTWPTQPIPQTPNTLFMPRMKNGSGRMCSSAKFWDEPTTTPDGHPLVFGCDFQPYDTTKWIVTPFENMDWPSSSYDPQTEGFVTCGDNGREFGHEQIPAASETMRPYGGIGAGVLSIGGNIPATNTGNFSSLDVKTDKFEWHQQWSEVCFSGSVDTASGLTFVGHLGTGPGAPGAGYLQAVNSKTGASLWQSPTMPAMAAAPPITYSVNGKQYVAGIAGGESHEDPATSGGFGSYIYAFALPNG